MNAWKYLVDETDVWTQYALTNQFYSLATVNKDNSKYHPEYLAKEINTTIVENNGKFILDVELFDTTYWSDGVQFTADDIVFTFKTIKNLKLAEDTFSIPKLLEDVISLSNNKVRFVFTEEPGIASKLWKLYGMPVFPKHYWEQYSSTKENLLKDEWGKNAPVIGAWLYDTIDPSFTSMSYKLNSSFVEKYRLAEYKIYKNGFSIKHTASSEFVNYGTVDESEFLYKYKLGPFFNSMSFKTYKDQDTAYDGLIAGEIDHVSNPLGIKPTLVNKLTNEKFNIIENEANGMRYSAFNLTRWPTSDLAFRKSICTFNKEKVITDIYQNEAFNLNGQIVNKDSIYYQEESGIIKDAKGLDLKDRIKLAVDTLKDAGWTADRWGEASEVGGVDWTSLGKNVCGPPINYAYISLDKSLDQLNIDKKVSLSKLNNVKPEDDNSGENKGFGILASYINPLNDLLSSKKVAYYNDEFIKISGLDSENYYIEEFEEEPDVPKVYVWTEAGVNGLKQQGTYEATGSPEVGDEVSQATLDQFASFGFEPEQLVEFGSIALKPPQKKYIWTEAGINGLKDQGTYEATGSPEVGEEVSQATLDQFASFGFEPEQLVAFGSIAEKPPEKKYVWTEAGINGLKQQGQFEANGSPEVGDEVSQATLDQFANFGFEPAQLVEFGSIAELKVGESKVYLVLVDLINNSKLPLMDGEVNITIDSIKDYVSYKLEPHKLEPRHLIFNFSPDLGYDGLRPTFSFWIGDWINKLFGYSKSIAYPTNFNEIVSVVFSGNSRLWHMYTLGWGLGVFPDHMNAFFEGGAQFNTPGYNNEEFNKTVKDFEKAKTLDDLVLIIKKQQDILYRDLPYLVLFGVGNKDAYKNIVYPFNKTLDG